MNKSISQIQKEVHDLAIEKGWYDQQRNPLELIALIMSELGEAVEEIRKGRIHCHELDGKPVGEVTELADAVIRILDYCEYFGLNLETAIEEKHEYNKKRSVRHGGKKY